MMGSERHLHMNTGGEAVIAIVPAMKKEPEGLALQTPLGRFINSI